MARQPDPKMLAAVSYYMAVTNALIIVVVFVSGRFESQTIKTLGQIIFWLMLVTSAVGLAAGWMARTDFKQMKVAESLEKRTRLGFWVNVAAFANMMLWLVVVIIRTISQAS